MTRQPESKWTKERNYESSNVASGRYNSAQKKLEITFNNGSTYHYKDVPLNTWRNLNRVKSKGKFVHRRLKKPGFEYEKVAAATRRMQLVKLAELNPEIELFPTQERARRRFLDQGQILLAHGTGTGKTLASIAAVEAGRDKGKVSRTLVVAPTSLRQNYVDTVKGVTQNRTVTTLGSKQEASKGQAEPAWTRNAGDYNVVGIEMFRKDPEGIVDRLGIDTVIFDEAHKGNNPQTSTFKSLMRVRPRVKNVVAMTGSEVTNNPADIIPLLDFVTNKKHDLPNVSAFKKDYIKKLPDRSKGHLWWKKKIKGEHVLRPEKVRELRDALAPHVDYATLDDLQGDNVPKKEISTIPVEMSKHQRKLYEYAMRQAGSVVSHVVKKNVPPNAKDVNSFFKSLILARKASNSIHTLDTDVSPEISAFQTPKVKKLLTDLKEHLDTTPDGQVMVYSNFINGGSDVVTAGLRQMGIPHGVFLGKQNPGSSEPERQKAVADFKKRKNRVLVMSSAGTEGVDLPDTTMIQMLDGHYNPAKIQQAEARGVRAGGQSHRKPEDRRVDIRRYVSKVPRGTSVDEWVYNIAERKDGLVGQFREVLKTMPSTVQFMDKQAATQECLKSFRDGMKVASSSSSSAPPNNNVDQMNPNLPNPQFTMNEYERRAMGKDTSYSKLIPASVGGTSGVMAGNVAGDALKKGIKHKGLGKAIGLGSTLAGSAIGGITGHEVGRGLQNKEARVKVPNRKLENRYSFQGLPVSIETAKGSTRSGTDKDGHDWSIKMTCDYGYIRGTEGGDGEHLDVFIGPDVHATHVYVVRQIHPKSGKFDEDKVLLGFKSKKAAWKAYKSNYDRLDHVQGIREIPLDAFKTMLKVHRGNRLSVDDRYLEKMSSLKGPLTRFGRFDPLLGDFGIKPTGLRGFIAKLKGNPYRVHMEFQGRKPEWSSYSETPFSISESYRAADKQVRKLEEVVKNASHVNSRDLFTGFLNSWRRDRDQYKRFLDEHDTEVSKEILRARLIGGGILGAGAAIGVPARLLLRNDDDEDAGEDVAGEDLEKISSLGAPLTRFGRVDLRLGDLGIKPTGLRGFIAKLKGKPYRAHMEFHGRKPEWSPYSESPLGVSEYYRAADKHVRDLKEDLKKNLKIDPDNVDFNNRLRDQYTGFLNSWRRDRDQYKRFLDEHNAEVGKEILRARLLTGGGILGAGAAIGVPARLLLRNDDDEGDEESVARPAEADRMPSAVRKVAAMSLPKLSKSLSRPPKIKLPKTKPLKAKPPKADMPKMTGLKSKTSGPPKMSTSPGSINLPGEKGGMSKAKMPKMSSS